VLADFRSWLQQAAAEPGAPAVTPDRQAAEPIDLHTLLGQFVALKHEVNLQTKAVRAQQEQNAEALRQLGQAVDMLQQAEARAAAADQFGEDELVRPLLKTLVDVADALGRARREVQRVREKMAAVLDQLAAEPAPEQLVAPPAGWWSRLFRRDVAPRPEPGRQTQELAQQVRQFLESIVTGYTMSLQRVERALQQHGLEAIPAAGQPFDPERMEVVAAVADSNRPAGEVVEEVRRGYLWRGRVFRYAQVSVAKAS
jgi:molecular chaperone GrpE